MIPIAAREATKFEPPELIKGNALPAKGSNPTMTAMLIPASIPIQQINPVASNVPSISGALRAMTNPRQISSTYIPTNSNAPNKPSSSMRTANMLSVGGTGKPVNLD